MKSTQRLLVILTLLLGPMLLGAQCATDFRDAIIGGAIDYVTGTTTSLLEQIIYPGAE